MLEDLDNEVEAINSIYGEGTLQSSPEDGTRFFVLRVPNLQTSLRIQFPLNYPETPPILLGTHSSGDQTRKGEAAHTLELYRETTARLFRPGEVCLYDVIEDVTSTLSLELDKPTWEDEVVQESSSPDPHEESHLEPSPPLWTVSDVVVELKSVFVARCVPIISATEARKFRQHLLDTDKKVAKATHNITAYRIQSGNGIIIQDCDDDGETAAGGRLLHLMQLMELWNVMVVVTRWYGGHKLGPSRFSYINNVARDAFVKAGLVPDQNSSKQEKRRKRDTLDQRPP